MRFRGDFYRERFFNTAGEIAEPPTSPVPTTPTVVPGDSALPPTSDGGTSVEPTNPMLEVQDQPTNDVASDDGQNDAVPTYTLSEVTDLIGSINPPHQPFPYYLPHPHMPGHNILVTESGGTIITDAETPATTISGGMGGGGGAMIEEEDYTEEKIAQPKKPTNTIIWLIVGAVVIYFGYKYLVKKN